MQKKLNEFNIRTRKYSERYYTVLDYIKEKGHYVLLMYNSNKDVVMLCEKHGIYKPVNTDSIVRSRFCACNSCKNEDKNKVYLKENRLKQISEYFKLKYDYSLLPKHIKVNDIVCIICKDHGIFKKRFVDHARKDRPRGCPECNSQFYAFSKTQFTENCKRNNGGNGIFYVIRCYNDEDGEEFYKVGITSLSVANRYSLRKASMPYNYEIMNIIESDAETIWNVENLFLSVMRKNFKYSPNIYFSGSKYECLKF